jgi:glycosyltransferase involved in cell wall biosynthesis
MKLGVPSVPSLVDAIAEGRYDLVHVVAPGPAGLGAWLVARLLELPLVGSYHTELGSYAGLRSGQAHVELLANYALGTFYGACDGVLSPSQATDQRIEQLGIEPMLIGRWDRGVDLERFSPGLRGEGVLRGEIPVLYVGRLTKEKGLDLLADAFLVAHARDPRLHLNLVGGGPEEEALRERLGGAASFHGWLYGSELPQAYASAEVFMFASQTDTYGQVINEAQASGVPVVAVGAGGPASLIEDGETGLLVEPTVEALAGGLEQLAGAPLLAERLRRAALHAVHGRTWEASMQRLAAGYDAALARAEHAAGARQIA